MEYNIRTHDLEEKYQKRMNKKMRGKPQVMQIIMSRTFSSALMILQTLEGIPFNELTFALYDFCIDVQFREVVRLYDAELELAAIDPDKFVFDLHPFYNAVTTKIRKENKYREFAEFMGEVIRLRTEKGSMYNEKITDAYLCIIFQTLEYLRKDKFDLNSYAYGVSTNGELLMGPCPLPYCDLPAREFQEAVAKGKKFKSSEESLKYLSELYKKRGIIIEGYDDFEKMDQMQKIHSTTTTAMFPFINEYTFDIVPLNYYRTNVTPLTDMTLADGDIEGMKDRLQHRNFTLPTNGAVFEVDDPFNEIIGVLLRETVYHDCVYMLYRIDTDKGSLSGYYDTKGKYLFSTIRDATIHTPYKNLCALILSLYSTQVLADVPKESLDNKFFQNGRPLKFKVYGKGGKLLNQYIKEKSHAGSSRSTEDYNKEERFINVIIRNLPEGRQASEEAKQLAAQYGYDLKPGQTFVRPFIKQVFVRKDRNSRQ